MPGYVGSGIAADAAINAPANCESEDTFITAQLFTDTPFDPKLCAVACEARSQYELARPPAGGPAKTCQFFNTYLLAKNNQVIGQYCALVSPNRRATASHRDGIPAVRVADLRPSIPSHGTGRISRIEASGAVTTYTRSAGA